MGEVEIISGPPRSSLEEIRDLGRQFGPQTPALKIVLFGSYARGTADILSDIDLCIIAETERSFPDRFLDFLPIIDRLGPTEAVVYTPAEWAELCRRPNGFVEAILSEGVTLYDRSEE